MAVILCLILVLLLVIIIFAVFSMRKNDEEEKTEYPTHFEILDENGDPIRKPVITVESGNGSDAPIQELQYFCIKDKGYHVSVWPKNAGMQNLDYIEFDIAGMSYRENIDEYIGEHSGTLEAEPTNSYDANAIKILADNMTAPHLDELIEVTPELLKSLEPELKRKKIKSIQMCTHHKRSTS